MPGDLEQSSVSESTSDTARTLIGTIGGEIGDRSINRMHRRKDWPRRPFAYALIGLAAALPLTAWSQTKSLDVENATIADLQEAMEAGTLTSEQLTQIYLARITAYDKQGPAINAVITLNPHAMDTARTLDAERRAGHVRGPLHGIPVVLKDNLDTSDLPTTGGCQLLAGSIPVSDAFPVTKLRAAGAIILAKMNLTELPGSEVAATDKSSLRPGFSTAGGQTLNPHDPARIPGGSSSGTGAGIAAAFGQLGLGTDSGGSLRNPAAANGIVALKPTYGLIGRSGTIPSASSFDVVGPMARNVYDIAVALDVLAGKDPRDPATAASVGHVDADYTRFLKAGSLKGARIGIARNFMGQDKEVDRVIEAAIGTLKKLGAVIIDPVDFPEDLLQSHTSLQRTIGEAEFKAGLGDYLRKLKPGLPHSLRELISQAQDPRTAYRSPVEAEALDILDRQALKLEDPRYLAARDHGLAATRTAIDLLFKQHNIDVILYPTSPRMTPLLNPASPGSLLQGIEHHLRKWWHSFLSQGSTVAPSKSATAGSPLSYADLTGYPDLTIPAGMTTQGVPVSISFFALAWSEPKLLAFAYDFERVTHARVLPKFTPAKSEDFFFEE